MLSMALVWDAGSPEQEVGELERVTDDGELVVRASPRKLGAPVNVMVLHAAALADEYRGVTLGVAGCAEWCGTAYPCQAQGRVVARWAHPGGNGWLLRVCVDEWN